MKTPEEIKKGLECCILETDDTSLIDHCRVCLYRSTGLCFRHLLEDALAYIQQLERERDAAVEDMTELMQLAQFCRHCKHLTDDGECTFDFAANKGQPWCWQWRGVPQEVE